MATTPTVSATTPQNRAASAQKPTATASMPFRIESVRDRDRYLNLLVYGEYGTGKTTLLGTACEVPQMSDVIMLDAESGDLSLNQYPDLDVIPIQRYSQVARVHEFLKLHCKFRVEQEQLDAGREVKGIDYDPLEKMAELETRLKGLDSPPANPRRYKTVIMDSLSEVEEYHMYSLLGVTDSTRLDDEVAGAEWAEYKKNHTQIQRMIRNFRDLPMHFLTAAAAQFAQDESKRRLFTVQLTGKLSKKVQGFMDMVGYLVVGSQTTENGTVPMRRLYVQPPGDAKYDAKNRFAVYKEPHFDNPSIGEILKKCELLKTS